MNKKVREYMGKYTGYSERATGKSNSCLVKNAAFTLVETLIALTVLGIVAAITIPQVVRRQIEASNRAKIKKVMTVIDFLMNKIVVENDIKSNSAIEEWADDNCQNTASYFKVTKHAENPKEGRDFCRFRTADGVWWDIENITHPVVSLTTEEDLDNPDSKTTFTLLAHFDSNGSLRVNDFGYETGENKAILTKVYNFINGIKSETVKSDTVRPYISCWSGEFCDEYDENGNLIFAGSGCSNNDISTCEDKEVYKYDEHGNRILNGSNCDGKTIESCEYQDPEINIYDPSTGKLLEKAIGCDSDDIKTCNVREAYDDHGNVVKKYSGCTGVENIEDCTGTGRKRINYINVYDETTGGYTKGDYCNGDDISSCQLRTTYDEHGKPISQYDGCRDECFLMFTYTNTYDSSGAIIARGKNCTNGKVSVSECEEVVYYNVTYND